MDFLSEKRLKIYGIYEYYMDTQEYKAKRNIVVHFLHYCIHVVKSKSESDWCPIHFTVLIDFS